MTTNARGGAAADYLVTLLEYYEAEIMGEAYFYCLADHFEERDKMILLARIERDAASTVEPLLGKYDLHARDEAELARPGRGYISLHQAYSWQEFMTYIVERYPACLDEFEALEAKVTFSRMGTSPRYFP